MERHEENLEENLNFQCTSIGTKQAPKKSANEVKVRTIQPFMNVMR